MVHGECYENMKNTSYTDMYILARMSVYLPKKLKTFEFLEVGDTYTTSRVHQAVLLQLLLKFPDTVKI